MTYIREVQKAPIMFNILLVKSRITNVRVICKEQMQSFKHFGCVIYESRTDDNESKICKIGK